MIDAFLSHNSADKAFVEELAKQLEDEAGLTVWLDKWHLVPGEDFQDGIEAALDECQTYTVFVGPAEFGPWHHEEMRAALRRRVRDKGRRVIPVLLPGTTKDDLTKLPEFLQGLLWVDFRAGLKDRAAFRLLVKGIRGEPPGRDDEAEAALSELLGKDIPEPAPLPPGSRMELSRNPMFVGRAADLRRLARALKVGQTTAIRQIAAATGLGGIGKTQLASEFVHRYGQYFAGGVFWLNFAEAEGVPTEIAACGGAGAMALYTDSAGLKQDEQVAMVQAAWRSAVPRLLVFDNCEDEKLLNQWRPASGGCRVLLTSRKGRWRKALGIQALRLGELARAESVALLQKHRPDLTAAEAEAIADELGDLPLALHVAGSFLANYEHSNAGQPELYLSRVQAVGLDHPSLKGEGETWTTAHERHVGRTFALSYGQLKVEKAVDDLALGLLLRATYFAPGLPIPRELLKATVKVETEDETELQLEDALARLVGLELLEVEADGALLLHRLLAEFVRSAGAAEAEAAQAAVEETLLAEARRLNQAGYPAPLLAWQPHLRAVTEAAEVRGDERAASLCAEMDYHLSMIGDYAGARPYSERALAIREKALGADHPSTAQSLNNLAGLLKDQGDYQAAQPLFERALAISEKALGADHPSTAQSLNNLAGLLKD